MDNTLKFVGRWVLFAGELVVAVVHWAQAVFVPIARGVLLAFVLAPISGLDERWSPAQLGGENAVSGNARRVWWAAVG